MVRIFVFSMMGYPSTPVEGADSNLYVVSSTGGTAGMGNVFELTTKGVETVRHDFDYTDGWDDLGGLFAGSDGVLYGSCFYGGEGAGTAFGISPSGGFATVADLPLTNGATPSSPLIAAPDGSYVGTAELGGKNGAGTVYDITTAGKIKILHSFDWSDGAHPSAAPLLAPDGNYYGITTVGGKGYTPGTTSGGAIYKMTTGGVVTIVHDATSADGFVPSGALSLGPDGALYGIASTGAGTGSIYKCTTTGDFHVLHNFTASGDGAYPVGGLVLGSDGYFYGVTTQGGTHAVGTLYRIAPNGSAYSLLYSFAGDAEGSYPRGGLVEASKGIFCAAAGGGTNGRGVVYTVNVSTKTVSPLHEFTTSDTVTSAYGNLILGSNGDLYGVAYGGVDGTGTVVYQLTSGGVFTSIAAYTNSSPLYYFQNLAYDQTSPLLEGKDGNLYGVRSLGGVGQIGSIFQIQTKLPVSGG